MRMAIVGTGYVGTVTGACLAELGHDVHCVDTDEALMARLQRGEIDFYETGLEALIKTNLHEGRLRFSTRTPQAVAEADVVFLCVGAHFGAASDKQDMRPLKTAMKAIASALSQSQGYKLIVEKSTLPISTGEALAQILQHELPEGCACDVDIAAVPHFMREGDAINGFFKPDRVVIGAETQRAKDLLVGIYSQLNAPMLITDINSAELIKHAANAFLAMKISFINSMASVCEKTGADVTLVARGLGMDKRIVGDYLNAGIGYGGIFFPKDIQSLLNIADKYHLNLDLLKTTEVVNRYQRIHFIERIERALGRLSKKTVAVWGLAFRPDTDDMRDAPSVHIIRGLQNRGATIRAFDPIAMPKTRELLPDIVYCDSPYEAAIGADAIAIVTDWPAFSHVDFQRLKAQSACRTIVDGRNMYAPAKMQALGYHYVSIGRKPVGSAPVAAV